MELQAVFWIVFITVGIVLGVFASAAAYRWLLRGARRRRYRREALASQWEASVQPPPRAAMDAEQAAAIQRHARDAAQQSAQAGPLQPLRNPHPQGTREFVLWAATYHLAETELAEEAEEAASTAA